MYHKQPIISFVKQSKPLQAMDILSLYCKSKDITTANIDEMSDELTINAEIDLFFTAKKLGDKNQKDITLFENFISNFNDLEEIETQCSELIEKLNDLWLERPLNCCILIGGKSSRMGSPKHLIKDQHGKTWLENSVLLVDRYVNKVVLSGRGDVPSSLQYLDRIEDVEGLAGPLAGVVSSFRHYDSSWLIIACDMPLITEESIEWLLSQRGLGRWGIVPVSNGPEPLFACYENMCGTMFEKLVMNNCLKIRKISQSNKIYQPQIPVKLLPAWSNINRPENIPT